MSVKVTISEVTEKIFSSGSISEGQKFQSSFLSAENPIGTLRLHGVSNGDYDWHHPVSDASNSNVGYLIGGENEIGYTYCCLYSDKSRRFFVSHVRYGLGQ